MDGCREVPYGELPKELRERLRRERELKLCGAYFHAIYRSQEPTDGELLSRDACAWADFEERGVQPSPRQALRMPHLAPQPKEWVRELLDEAENGRG